MIPPFNERGVLPSDGEATLNELRMSQLVTGQGVESAAWDSDWRGELVDRLAHVFDLFSRVGGVAQFWIDGSFVEAVDHPRDIDAYFTLQNPRDWLTLPGRLDALEGDEIWTWDPSRRTAYHGSVVPKPPFWGRYRVDIYPDLGRPCGIFDANGAGMTFSEAFRQQRMTYRRKGAVRIRRCA